MATGQSSSVRIRVLGVRRGSADTLFRSWHRIWGFGDLPSCLMHASSQLQTSRSGSSCL